ncbi:caspase recruitment domain-containing protein 18-like [Festucalex cinctus]
MAAQLLNVRPEFVDNVTEPVVTQLLDDVRQDGILSKGEVQYIRQANNYTADRARDLIDTVTGKGDEASVKLIKHIQIRNPHLATSLGLNLIESMDMR